MSPKRPKCLIRGDYQQAVENYPSRPFPAAPFRLRMSVGFGQVLWGFSLNPPAAQAAILGKDRW
jgi:hypothetical protein